MKLRVLPVIFAVLLVSSGFLCAKNGWQTRIPNGSKFGCATCHLTTFPNLNNFGKQFGLNTIWSSLYKLDADGDGFTNGAELQDPDGVWTSGDIGDPSKVTNPADASSFPTSVFESKSSMLDKLLVDITLSSGIAMLKFSISTPGNTYAVVYDMMGNLVLKSEYGNLAEGSYNMLLPLSNEEGKSLGKGVFFVRIISGKTVKTAKIVL